MRLEMNSQYGWRDLITMGEESIQRLQKIVSASPRGL